MAKAGPLTDTSDPAIQLMAVEFVQLEADLFRLRDENAELRAQLAALQPPRKRRQEPSPP